MIEVAARHCFAAGSLDCALLKGGWSAPVPDGTWTLGAGSTLSVPIPPGKGRIALDLDIDPQIEWPHARLQTLRVRSGRTKLGQRTLSGPLTWRIEVPDSLDHKGSLPLALDTGAVHGPPVPGVRLRALTVLRVRQTPLPQAVRPLTTLLFGWNEADNGQLDEGWGQPEDGYVWAIGGRSTMRLPTAGMQGPCLALIDMRPFKHAKAPPAQRVTITLTGARPHRVTLVERLIIAVPYTTEIGQSQIGVQFDSHDADFDSDEPLYHHGKPFAWALSCVRIVPAIAGTNAGIRPPVPGSLADGSMQDFVQRLTGLDARTLAAGFEGLGNGCELGNLQIFLGHDRPGLLRYCAIRQRELIEGLFSGFFGVCRIDQMKWEIRREEDDTWRLIEEAYGISSATPYKRNVPPPLDGQYAASIRSPWLAGKLLQDIGEAVKMFVVRISEPVDEDGIMAVAAALRHYGNAKLLWLVTDGRLPPGTVERLPNGLMRGHLQSPATGLEITSEAVLSTLANAWVLFRQAR